MPMPRSIFPFLAITVVLTAGCGLPIIGLHEDVDLNQASFRDKLAASGALADEFLACTKQAYDDRGPMARGTERTGALPPTTTTEPARTEGYLAPIRAVIERVKAKQRARAESLSAIEDLLRDWTNESRHRLDLNALKRVVDVIRQWHGHLDFDEDELSQDTSRFAQLLLAYNKAYFGDIRFTVEPSASGTGIRAATKVTSSGFTDRNGNTWIFPGLSLEVVNPSGKSIAFSAVRADSQRISADLARVFLEAFFDAAFREPAVQGATALQIAWKGSGQVYPAFDADHAPIPLEALGRVTRDALRAEAAVTSLVGKVVRGGSVFSVQNETVAATLETAAGVIAKKLIEHEGFCYFQVLQEK
ncbi:MAG TPA: hypothetical protein VKP13_15405 [Nitrospira sp.]|nr:hypothetical protein [Nitrospira sp.]